VLFWNTEHFIAHCHACMLEETLFQESDEFTVRVGEDLDEAIRLMEAGFEYVIDMTNGAGSSIVKIFRKRK